MSLEDYVKAYKMGKREYHSRMFRGENPNLEVLEKIMPEKGSYSEMPLGIEQIPASQIVGTKTEGRKNAFASNFMPILEDNTEFAQKWIRLCDSHLNEGIREPIKAYEYMNRYYVEEGNKRVSVMKYFGVVSIPGSVTRIVPRRTNEKKNKIYYEYMDFHQLTRINYVLFSELGCYERLLKVVGKEKEEEWTDEERLEFNSVYTRFSSEFRAEGGDKLEITVGDAFLTFAELHGYEAICNMTMNELKELISKSWEEFKLLEHGKDIELKMNPSKEKKTLFSRLLPTSAPKLKVAFIYEKTPETSAWTYAHELGRMHLEEAFSDEVSTLYYENITRETIEQTLEEAIKEGCNLIFSTTPSFVQASVKVAIENPDIRIVSCALNASHRYIRTYYARMHEAKFLMGAIAGAMTTNDKIAYIADYPIYGTVANINAFALGARMTNPRVKVYLEWSCKKDCNIMENIAKSGATVVSGKDMVTPKEASRYFGLYYKDGENISNIAMPVWHWGKFYEQMIRTIMDGMWKLEDSGTAGGKKAINYWWGMSAGVIDVICSKNLPIGTKRLVDLLKKTIMTGELEPFSGLIYGQNGVIQEEENEVMKPERIITMNWLAENIVGSFPMEEELLEEAKSVVLQQGIFKKG